MRRHEAAVGCKESEDQEKADRNIRALLIAQKSGTGQVLRDNVC